MSQDVIRSVESAFKREKPLNVRVGDTVTVYQRIVEGDKERVQPFSGVVIAKRGTGTNGSFTVRRIVNNEGVERIFPMVSPKVVNVETTRSGKVRRAKLYYLRERVGKARRLRDRRGGPSIGKTDMASKSDAADGETETSTDQADE
jgi:large subunit ribosomal protein L19